MPSHRLPAILCLSLFSSACTTSVSGDPETERSGPDAAAPAQPFVDASPRPGRPDGGMMPDAAPPCVEGDANAEDPDTGNCYMFFSTPRTWQQAVGHCESLGAHLTDSTSRAENDVFSPLAGQADAWIGGNDIVQEGVWVWNTGEAMSYQNWRAGEPNNKGGEDCMVIEGDNGGLWDDRPCGLKYVFICERE